MLYKDGLGQTIGWFLHLSEFRNKLDYLKGNKYFYSLKRNNLLRLSVK